MLNIGQASSFYYIVPSYQRPYVWQQEQIEKLIYDIWKAYLRSDHEYFIGTVMVSENNGRLELIDGQQRFTTLWLIALAFEIKGVKTELSSFLQGDQGFRLSFAVREQVRGYLSELFQHRCTYTEQYNTEKVQEDEYLRYIAEAITTVQGLLGQLEYTKEKTMAGFAIFFCRQVWFVQNTCPVNADLNKMFATINTSGIQLEQTDILKARLLKDLTSEKILYSKIWEACEDLNNFFPYVVTSIFHTPGWKSMDLDSLQSYDSSIFRIKQTEKDIVREAEKGQTIQQILDSTTGASQPGPAAQPQGNKLIECRSIINFGQLLLHTLRIYLKSENLPDFSKPFHIKNLLSIFEDAAEDALTSEEDIKAFIRLLWEIRYLFDRHIIKWVVEDEEEAPLLAITNIRIDEEGGFSKDIAERSSLSMLQSVLYHTSDHNTHYWLTPYLFQLKQKPPGRVEILEHIDNQLSLSQDDDKSTSFVLMEPSAFVPDPFDFKTYLQQSEGTAFRRYWFQKLEYVLWKNWPDRSAPKFKDYRITRKNSIEHVFPRNHEFNHTISPDADEHNSLLNSFGNLGLLSTSQNSSYSNQDVEKKKIDFERKPVYDSLKLAKIYESSDVETWQQAQIKQHAKDMIELLEMYYKPGGTNS